MNPQSPQDLPTPGLTLSDGRRVLFEKPAVMGILNVTPDSFSDGGRFVEVDAAVERALAMVEEGAEIIDIGGESSRPGAEPVTADEEIARVKPVIKKLRRQSDVLISIDTYHAATARAALEAGADIVNDISALRFDAAMLTILTETGCPAILMHMQGTPRDMQKNPHYEDCVSEVCAFLLERATVLMESGVDRGKIALDPGIGFGKRLEDNLALLANLDSLVELGFPVLVGASRKSFIAKVNPASDNAEDRLGGSIASAILAAELGVSILRVHDVKQTVEALAIAEAVRHFKA